MDHGFTFTIGIEEEFQIVDPETCELRSHVAELLESGAPDARRADQARDAPVHRRGRHEDLRRTSPRCATRSTASAASSPSAPNATACASPPPARTRSRDWMDQVISPGERYENIVEEMQQLARSLLIFGLHVHVAMPDRIRRRSI